MDLLGYTRRMIIAIFNPPEGEPEHLGDFEKQEDALVAIAKHVADTTCIRLGVVKGVAFKTRLANGKVYRLGGVSLDVVRGIQALLERYEMRVGAGRPRALYSEIGAQRRLPFLSPEE